MVWRSRGFAPAALGNLRDPPTLDSLSLGGLPMLRRSRVVVFALVVLASASATAQTPAPSTPAASPDQIRELIGTLSDSSARAKLVAELETLVAAQQKAAPATPSDWVAVALTQISDGMAAITTDLAETGKMAHELPYAGRWLRALATDPDQRDQGLDLVLRLIIVLAAAIAGEWLVMRLIARPRRSVEQWSATTTAGRWLLLLARVALALVPIAAFVGAAYLVLPLATQDETTRLVVIALINANVLVRGLLAAGRRVLLPASVSGSVRTRRLVAIDDATAVAAYGWLRLLGQVCIYGFFLVSAMSLLGVPRSARDLLLRIVGLAVTTMLVILIVRGRGPVARGIAGGRAARDGAAGEWQLIRARLAEVWHVLAIGYVVGAFLVWALAIRHGFSYLAGATVWTALTLALLRLALIGLHRLSRLGAAQAGGTGEMSTARVLALLPPTCRVLEVVLYLIAGLGILQAWDIDVVGWLESPLGHRILAGGFSIMVILAVAIAAWEIASVMIARSLAYGAVPDAPRSRARLRTLLPLLHNALTVVIVVLTALVVLSELGIDIAPLLAGAGVVGLAIGFGAQSLVKDVITGLFYLFEDTVNVGDVVDVGGGHSGFVESMSIRSIRLRDVEGSVHTVPFSTVAAIKNMTKDFGYSVLDIFIDYRSDLERAIATIGQIEAELRQDKIYGPMITAPTEIMGVEKFADNAVVLRCRTRTVPIQRWTLGREFNRRIKLAFDIAGIGMVAAVPPPEIRSQEPEDSVEAAPTPH